MDGRQVPTGVLFLLATFSLSTQRESSSGAGRRPKLLCRGLIPAFAICRAGRSKTPKFCFRRKDKAANAAKRRKSSARQPDQTGEAPAPHPLPPIRIEPRIGEGIEPATVHARNVGCRQPLPCQGDEVAVP